MERANESLAHRLLFIMWSAVTLSGVFIALKLLARTRKRLLWWWDDYVMLLSWLCLGAGSVFLTNCVVHGLGRHIEFLDAEARTLILQYGNIAATLTVSASAWSKVSYGLFLLRISSSGCTEWTRKVILGIIASLNIMLPVVATTFFVSCRPVAKIWRPDMDGTCWPPSVKVNLARALAAYSGAVDLALAFIPWKIIWCLPVQRRDKVGLVAIMSLGVVAAAASFIKCAYVGIIAAQDDFSYDGAKLVLWSVVEPSLTIIAACIPVVRTFFRDLVRALTIRRANLAKPQPQQVPEVGDSLWTSSKETILSKLAFPAATDQHAATPASKVSQGGESV